MLIPTAKASGTTGLDTENTAAVNAVRSPCLSVCLLGRSLSSCVRLSSPPVCVCIV